MTPVSSRDPDYSLLRPLRIFLTRDSYSAFFITKSLPFTRKTFKRKFLERREVQGFLYFILGRTLKHRGNSPQVTYYDKHPYFPWVRKGKENKINSFVSDLIHPSLTINLIHGSKSETKTLRNKRIPTPGTRLNRICNKNLRLFRDFKGFFTLKVGMKNLKVLFKSVDVFVLILRIKYWWFWFPDKSWNLKT